MEYASFEREALKLLNARAYEPDSADTLLAAFRALDPKNTGSIDLDKLQGLLCTATEKNEDPMRSKEWEAFAAIARGPTARGGAKGGAAGGGSGSGATPRPGADSKEEPEPERVYYEDYVALMSRAR